MGLCKPHSKTQKDVLFMELLEPRQLLAVNIAPLAPPDSVTSIDPKTDYLVETIANDTFEEAAELGPKALIAGTLPKNDVDVYTFNVTNSFADVRLVASGGPNDPIDLAMELFDAEGNLLLRSDGTPDDPRGAQISVQLGAGKYFLRLSRNDSNVSVGTYSLTAVTFKTEEPNKRLGLSDDQPIDSVIGDFNGDGLGDVAVFYTKTTDVSFFYNDAENGFVSEQRFSFDQPIRGLQAADVDGDGDDDLLAILRQDGTPDQVVLYRNDGDDFAEIFRVQANGAVLTDLDGNGALDLIVQTRTGLSIYAGDNTGRFDFSDDIELSVYDSQLTMGHFNHDDRLDLATFDEFTGSVRFLLQQPDGHFESILVHAKVTPGAIPDGPGSFSPHSLVAADFNNDGQDDIATADVKGTLRLLLSTPNGGYSLRDDIQLYLEDSNRLLAADFDGDGRVDLAASRKSLGFGSIYFQTDFGWTSNLTLSSSHGQAVITVGDIDGDGAAREVVVLNPARDRFDAFAVSPQREGVSLGERQAVGIDPVAVVTGDFNGDDIPDLAVRYHESGQVVIRIGTGNNTFANDLVYQVPFRITHLETGDITGDGRDDLVVRDQAGRVHVLASEQDHSLTLVWTSNFTTAPGDLAPFVLGDFDDDGLQDLAIIEKDATRIEIFSGSADGHLQPVRTLAASNAPRFLRTGDLNNDGKLDLFALGSSNIVEAFSFLGATGLTWNFLRQQLNIGLRNIDFAVVDDLDNDGYSDIVASWSNEAHVLLNQQDGTLKRTGTVTGFIFPTVLQTGDFNNDRVVDLVTGSNGSDHVRVALGNGDGTYRETTVFDLMGAVWGEGPKQLVVADFNGDGLDDVAAVDPSTSHPDDVVVLYSQSNGDFGSVPELVVGAEPHQSVIADFNGDSFADVAVINPSDRSVYVFLGQGNGRFSDRLAIRLNDSPYSITAGDFNGDGVIDLATANWRSPSITVLFGNNDGTFKQPQYLNFNVDDYQGFLKIDAVAVNNDNRDDLVIIYSSGAEVRLAGPNGMFLAPRALPDGVDEVADFNGDGFGDLLVNSGYEFVIHYGGPEGFKPGQTHEIDYYARDFTVVDVNGDGLLDLLTGSAPKDGNSFEAVAVYLQHPDGSFGPEIRSVAPATELLRPRTGDFNNDGYVDVVLFNLFPSTDPGYTFSYGPVVMLGDGTGHFEYAVTVRTATRLSSNGVEVADLDGDGRDDLFLATSFSAATVLLSTGDGTFFKPADRLVTNERPTPQLADVDADGILDSLIVDREGNLLLRRGNRNGTFGSPSLLNVPKRFSDAFFLSYDSSIVVAATHKDGSGVSIYALAANGALELISSFDTDASPKLIRSGDLNLDGRDDLVVVADGTGDLVVYLQDQAGNFMAAKRIAVGLGVADLDIANLDAVHGPDILVTNQFSGAVVALLNNGFGTDFSIARYRTGQGYYGVRLDKVAGTPEATDVANTSIVAPVLTSEESSSSVVIGDFDGDRILDLIVSNYANHTLGFLKGNGAGGFLDPVVLPVGVRPSMLAVADLDRDQILDLAVLDDIGQELLVLLGKGDGTFFESFQTEPGSVPTGLSIADANRDGMLDLIVGNRFGDVLTLQGDGTGKFAPPKLQNSLTALAVADLDRDGVLDVIQADDSLNELSVRFSASDAEFIQGWEDGLLAPEAVQSVDLNGDGLWDLVVANSGANNILVYFGADDGGFESPLTFAAGTRPTAITLTDVDGDGLIDVLVANAGSNDVSVLLGATFEDASGDTVWTLVSSRRLSAGMSPSDVQLVQDLTGDQIDDLVVTSSSDGSVTLLPGLGGGFFDDNNAQTISIPAPPTGFPATNPAPVFADFDNDGMLDFAVAAGDSILFISSFKSLFVSDAPDRLFRSISGGINKPVALASADVTGDQIADLIIANRGDGTVRLLAGGVNGLQGSAEILLDQLGGIADMTIAANLEHELLTIFVARDNDKNVFAFDLNMAKPDFKLDLDFEIEGETTVTASGMAVASTNASVAEGVGQVFRLLAAVTGLPGGGFLSRLAANQIADAFTVSQGDENFVSATTSPLVQILRSLAGDAGLSPQVLEVVQGLEETVEGLARVVDQLLQEPLARFNEMFQTDLTTEEVRESVADVLVDSLPTPLRSLMSVARNADGLSQAIADAVAEDRLPAAVAQQQAIDEALAVSFNSLDSHYAAEVSGRSGLLDRFDSVFAEGLDSLLATAAVTPPNVPVEVGPPVDTGDVAVIADTDRQTYRYLFASLFVGTLIGVLARAFRTQKFDVTDPSSDH